MIINKRVLITGLILLMCSVADAEKNSINQTKTALNALENKINSLQKTLHSAHNKQEVINHELADTEKKIGEGVHQLRNIHQEISNKQLKINQIQQKINQLNKQLQAQQQLLAKHLRIRYKIGEYQPLKWLLNQDEPQTISRLLTFYRYVIQSHQNIIAAVHVTKKNLDTSISALNGEIKVQQQLQLEQAKQQQKLAQEKLYQTELLRSLNRDIKTAQQTLEEYQRNKANLSRILKSLIGQSIMRTQQPFPHMRHKLLRPVHTNKNNIEKINLGLTFPAPEGEPVAAVYAGKVIFSDWLKGYGLLLIIDHGHGFMTLYAHNQSLFKQKGEIVMQGEQIATVGHSGGVKQNGLYFEIRHAGKAIPALEWLAK